MAFISSFLLLSSNFTGFDAGGLRFALQIDILDLLGAFRGWEWFLICSLVLGNWLFCLFFYTVNRRAPARQHWDSLGSQGRSFWGFLFGVLVLLSFSGGLLTLLHYVSQRILLVKPSDPINIWGLSSLIIGLTVFILRLKVMGPIHSEAGKNILGNPKLRVFLQSPVYVLIFLIIVANSSSTALYPLSGNSLQALWFGLFWTSLLFALFSVWFPWCVFYLVSAPSIYPDSTSGIQLRFPFESFESSLQFLREMLVLLRQMTGKYKSAIIVLAVVIFLGVFTPLIDAQFGLFTPKVEYIETKIGDSYDVVGSIEDYVVLIEVTKSYFISPPYVLIVRNVTISNSSNYSYSDGSFWGKISSRLIGSNAGLSEIKGLGNRVTAFNVIFQQQPQRCNIGLETSYRDRLNASLINAVFQPITEVGNNTFQREIQITVRNSLSKRVHFQTLPVMTEFWGQIIQATCKRDGGLVDWCHYDEKYLEIWLPDLDPGKQLNVVLTVVFSR